MHGYQTPGDLAVNCSLTDLSTLEQLWQKGKTDGLKDSRDLGNVVAKYVIPPTSHKFYFILNFSHSRRKKSGPTSHASAI